MANGMKTHSHIIERLENVENHFLECILLIVYAMENSTLLTAISDSNNNDTIQ